MAVEGLGIRDWGLELRSFCCGKPFVAFRSAKAAVIPRFFRGAKGNNPARLLFPQQKLRTLLCVFVAPLLLVGCGRSGLTLGKVGGQVTVDGKPVKEGVILFVPERGPGASGLIDNGQYSLTTRTSGDGAVVGRHKVYFAPKPPAGDPNTEVRECPAPPPPPTSDFPPAKYATPESSGLTVEVKPGTNVLDFDLESIKH
jgi:hypothetical protein